MDPFISFCILSFSPIFEFRFLRDIISLSNRFFLNDYPEFDFSFSNIIFEFVISILPFLSSVVAFSTLNKPQMVLYSNFFFSNPFCQNRFVDILVSFFFSNLFQCISYGNNPFEYDYMDRVVVEYKKKVMWNFRGIDENKSIFFNFVDNRNIIYYSKDSGFRFLENYIIGFPDQKVYSNPNFSI